MVVEAGQIRGRFRRWWSMWVVGGVDHDAVLRQIAEDSGWSGRYAFLIVISAAISLLGLLMPSIAVLIGAMLLSPLMMPIIGLGFWHRDRSVVARHAGMISAYEVRWESILGSVTPLLHCLSSANLVDSCF